MKEIADYYEIDSSSKKDAWLHDAMQKMSLKQLDVFFSAISKLIYGPPCNDCFFPVFSNTASIVSDSIFFQTNRIERRFKVSFQTRQLSRVNLQPDLRNFVCSIAFLACDGLKRNFMKNYALHCGIDRLPKIVKREFEETRVSLMGNRIVANAAEKMFGRRWKIFRKIRWFYYRRLVDGSWPMLSLLVFGVVSVFITLLVVPAIGHCVNGH